MTDAAHDQLDADCDCIISGGGPAGIVAGLLLARGGVKVVVLEKHIDFFAISAVTRSTHQHCGFWTSWDSTTNSLASPTAG